MICVFYPEVSVKLSHFVCGAVPEKVLKDAKSRLLATYHKRSASVTDTDHGQKMKRVQHLLCDLIRRTGRILNTLMEKRVLTNKEYDTISHDCTVHKLTERLINVLSDKPESGYEMFLEALDATNQNHLHRLLEEEGFFKFFII